MYKKINILGVTGRIACGKNTISQIIADKYNYKIIDVDQVGHLFLSKQHVLDEIFNQFGDAVIKSNKVDRKALGDLVFSDSIKLLKLEAILHPLMHNYIEDKVKTEGRWLINAAILFKMKLNLLCDEIWAIDADNSIIVERLKNRGINEKKAFNILSNQLSRSFFDQNCDRVILNNNNEEFPEI